MFGLELADGIREPAVVTGRSGPRAAAVRPTTRTILDTACPPATGTRIGGIGGAELRDYGTAGLVWRSSEYSDHRISHDGTIVESVAEAAWERFLFAQVLPLAALLQGLEVLHAGAVVLGDSAVVMTGPSGTGKSTLVAALVAEGAGFLTDDVAALERDGDTVRVHPGPRLPQGPPPVPAAPVGTLVALRPVPEDRPIRAEAARPDPRLLLGANFIPVIRSADRLERLLDLCARMAETTRFLALDVPRRADPHAVTARLREQLGE